MPRAAARSTTRFALGRREWPLAASLFTTALFLFYGNSWLGDLADGKWFAVILAWLFAAILASAFAVVRHAEALATRTGEPYGTLVLTVCMSGMEMMMISAVMFVGKGAPSLARDTMLAILMIVLNGLIGLCLLVGGMRFHEQKYNLYGANAFLAVILPLAVLGLVLPAFTVSTPDGTFSTLQAIFLIVMSVSLYGIFLVMQTRLHREYFVAPVAGSTPKKKNVPTESTAVHAALLVAYAVPIVLLAKQIAVPINHGIEVMGAPAALGGLLVAVLILAPESMAAVRAAADNQLQRSINVSLGTALSSICLTIPAVLLIGFITGQKIVLGLDPAHIVLLVLTLVVSLLTFALERTNVLLGAVHIVLFLTYFVLLFDR
jgi:Ca2+:H+ antiporter